MIVEIDEKAVKDLSKIDNKDANHILDKINDLKNFPDTSNIKKLVGFKPKYRYRVGNYRVLFDIENNILTIYQIVHRRNAYF